ncbi:MAG: hypothetical protein H6631_18605 [Anaerolineaceae bacterium]|nr:hypothetical protein [Anaerolineaceae bacterium]
MTHSASIRVHRRGLNRVSDIALKQRLIALIGHDLGQLNVPLGPGSPDSCSK